VLSGSSKIPNAPREHPTPTWHAPRHHGGKHLQKKNSAQTCLLPFAPLSLSLLARAKPCSLRAGCASLPLHLARNRRTGHAGQHRAFPPFACPSIRHHRLGAPPFAPWLRHAPPSERSGLMLCSSRAGKRGGRRERGEWSQGQRSVDPSGHDSTWWWHPANSSSVAIELSSTTTKSSSKINRDIHEIAIQSKEVEQRIRR